MAITIRGSGQTVSVREKPKHVSVRLPEKFKMGVKTGIIEATFPDYEGEYEVDSRFSEQIFPTKLKTMRDDFTVHAINYTEAPNEYGTTLTIGG
jgi:hypothetical protein